MVVVIRGRLAFTIALGWLVAMGTAGAASNPNTQSAPPPPAENAATAYAEAHAIMAADGFLSDEEWSLLSDVAHGVVPLRGSAGKYERARLIIERLGPMFTAVSRATAVPECDWQLDLSKGFALELPHLDRQRSIMRWLGARSALALDAGDMAGVVATQRELMALARHSGQDEILIGGLVGVATASWALHRADDALESGMLSAEQASELSTLYRGMANADTFHLGDAMDAEGEILAATLRDSHQRDELAQSDFDDGTDFDMLADMDDQEAERQIEGMSGLYKRTADVLRIDDPAEAKAAMDALMAEVKASDNPLAKVLFPSVDKALESRDRLRRDLLARAALFDAIARGEGPEAAGSQANAAYWYRRAAQGALAIPADVQTAAILALAAPETIDARSAQLVRDVRARTERSIGEPLRAAGSIQACRLREQVGSFDVELMGGLRGAIRLQLAAALLEARARIAGNAGDIAPRRAQVLESLTSALRAVRHLAQCPTALHALASATILEDAVGTLEAVQRDMPGLLDEPALEALRVEVGRLSAIDPCGFAGAKAGEVEFLFGGPMPFRADPAVREARLARARELPINELLYVRAVWCQELPACIEAEDLVRWDDLLPPARVAEAMAANECMAGSALAASDPATIRTAPVLGTCRPFVIVDVTAAEGRPVAAWERLQRALGPASR